MNEELKELLNNLKSVYELNKPLTEKYKEDCMRFIINTKEAELLLDYITNLQKENEKLNEDNILIKSGNQLLSKKINKILELVNDIEWRLDDVHDLIDGYDEIKEIINIGEINE